MNCIPFKVIKDLTYNVSSFWNSYDEWGKVVGLGVWGEFRAVFSLCCAFLSDISGKEFYRTIS